MTTGHDIAEAARRLIGVPFRHQGRDPDVGLDCVGVVVVAYDAAGIALHGRTDYPRRPSGPELRGMLREQLREVAPGMPWGPGDVLLIRDDGNRYGLHVAIAVGDGLMVTADRVPGVRARMIHAESVEAAYRARGVA